MRKFTAKEEAARWLQKALVDMFNALYFSDHQRFQAQIGRRLTREERKEIEDELFRLLIPIARLAWKARPHKGNLPLMFNAQGWESWLRETPVPLS